MFKWLSKNYTKRSLNDPSIPLSKAYDLLVNNPSTSSVYVNEKSALSNPAIFRGVSLIANGVARIDFHVYSRSKDGDREVASKHPAEWLLRYPSETMDEFTFKQCLIKDAILYGNSYSYIFRNEFGNPTELMMLDPQATYVAVENGIQWFVTIINNEQRKLPVADVIHIRGLGDSKHGYPIIDLMREAIGVGLALQRYQSYYFKQGSSPGIIFEFSPAFMQDPEKIEHFKAEWERTQSGLDNSHKVCAIPTDTKITPLEKPTNEQGQFLQSREHDLIMVADLLNIENSKLGGKQNTSYNSLMSAEQAFLQDSLEPWVCILEQQLTRKLLSERQKFLGSHYIEGNRESVLKPNPSEKIGLVIDELNNGLVSEKKAMQLLNLPTDKKLSDGWRRPSNIIKEGEEPAQPQQPPAPVQDKPQEKQPTEKPDTVARAMTKVEITRMVNRLRKSLESSKTDIYQHRSAFLENLPIPGAERFVDNVLDRVDTELREVLPEQRAMIADRLDIDQLTEELWNTEHENQK